MNKRCVRCGHTFDEHFPVWTDAPPGVCHRYAEPAPVWVRFLVWLSRKAAR